MKLLQMQFQRLSVCIDHFYWVKYWCIFLSAEMICNFVTLFPSRIGWHDPGKMHNSTGTVWFLKVTLQRAVPPKFMGFELYGFIFAVNGINLSKISHDFACVISQIETLTPVSIFYYWWISAFSNYCSSGKFFDNFHLLNI